MKKTLLFVTLIASSFYSISQQNFWKETNGVFYYNNGLDQQTSSYIKQKDHYKDNNIKSIEQNSYIGKDLRVEKAEFDTEGRIVKKTNTTKKHSYNYNYKYDKNDNLIEVDYSGSKNHSAKITFTYNEKNQLIQKDIINQKGEYKGLQQTFNKDGKILSKKIFDKDRENPVHELIYTYYDDGSKKSETYYKKGKLKYQWNYDCKSEGELIGIKNKDNSTICIKEETDANGNRVVWRRDFNDRGELIKTRTVYDKDSAFLETKTFKEDNSLIYYSIQKEDGGIKSINYDKKGNESRSYETFVNSHKQPVKIKRKGKYPSTYFYTYDKNLKKMQVRIFKKNTYVDEYAYAFY